MNKKQIRAVIGTAIVITIAYSLIVFLLPFNKVNFGSFIVAYVGGLIGILSQIFFEFMHANNEKARTNIFNLSLAGVGLFYCIVQVSFSLIIFIFGCYSNIDWWITLVFNILIILLFYLIFISYKQKEPLKETIKNSGKNKALKAQAKKELKEQREKEKAEQAELEKEVQKEKAQIMEELNKEEEREE